MSETKGHDPLCHAYPLTVNGGYHDPECCDCALIAKVRADERERLGLAFMHSDEIRRDAKGATLSELRAKVEQWDKRYTLVEVSDVLAMFKEVSE